jgi:response regulator RpfG family c-di-GMP phosphodiesterase
MKFFDLPFARLLQNGGQIQALLESLGLTEPDGPLDPGDPSDELSLKVGAFIALVTVGAAASILFFAPRISSDGWQSFVTLIFLAIVFERGGIKIYGDTHVSAGVVALFAISILHGPAGAAIGAPIVVLAAELFSSSRWHQRAFDVASYTVANVGAALLLSVIVDLDSGATAWWVPAALVASAVNYGINGPLVATAVHLATGEDWASIWREKYQWILPYYVIFGLLGAALAAAYLALGIPGIMAFVAPPLMMRFALHQYVTKTERTVLQLREKNAELEEANHNILGMTRQLTETYDGTLEALVLALDARDRETKGHSFRVASYVLIMARYLGVEEGTPEWIDMQRGALLHDVGKIGVPDFILHKPGPLTPEEWDDMKRHPRIGFEMLKDIAFLSGASAIVAAHHERFDGKGYPRGLRGDEIPLGARIFAAADTFDAMTSDRPYRKALSAEEAREEIVRHSGTQFDPQVVQAFLLTYDEIALTAASDAHREHARAA